MAKTKKNRKPPRAERAGATRSALPTRFEPPIRMATEPQKKWIRDMLDNKQLDKWPTWAKMTEALSPKKIEAFRISFKERVDELTFDQATSLIEKLKFLPRIGATTNGGHTNGGIRIEYEVMADDNGRTTKRGRIILKDGRRVLAGSYGLKTKGEEWRNSITFFRVWIGDRGGWNVQMFVSDDTSRVELTHDRKLWALAKIAKNPEKAAARFGHEFKRCGICGRGLTKDESRERGIGPVCAGRL